MHQQNQVMITPQAMLLDLLHQPTYQLAAMLQVTNPVRNRRLDLGSPLPRRALARHSIRPQQHSMSQLDQRPSNNSVSG